ncbi:unnamed protein product [Candidula unifasciata]|uniref:Uncharacterized protein n=1 Tax=Candidula unifasciata TaxID=100452 RepID=A0A8S3ZUH8_9EUPU|nr:unnamed protein product [Candidula unifasciata]
MSDTDIILQSEQVHHRMNSVPDFSSSWETDLTEPPAGLASDDEDSQSVQRYSRTSSLCDDSGFNSSTSEDRDDAMDTPLRHRCDFDSLKSLIRNVDIQVCDTPDSLLSSQTHSSEESNSSAILSYNFKNSPVEMKISNNTISEVNSHSLISNLDSGSNISDNSSVNSDISNRNTGRISRRHRTDNQNSQAVPGAPLTPRAPSTPRASRSRRHRTRDLNNNDSGRKNLNSYLSTPPFKLQDCFQNQGLLSLVACITYTVFLMIIFCLLGVVCDYVKSVVGKQNLRELRADIVQSRHTRTNMASG